MIRLRVYGVPAPQGSKSAFVRGGHAVVVEGGSKKGRERHAGWRQAIATAARDWQQEHDDGLLEGPIGLVVCFYLPKPKSTPKKVLHPVTRPDLDKLIRSVLDSVTGVLIRDDSQVVAIVASKAYDTVEAPGCVMNIGPIEDWRITDTLATLAAAAGLAS